MSHNALSPAFVKLTYVVATRAHIATIPVNYTGSDAPGSSASSVNLTAPSGAVTFAAFIDAYVAAIVDFFNTGASITMAELWKQPTPDDDPLFISVYTVGEAGTSASATVAASQANFSFRSATGGKAHLRFMETRYSINLRDDFPFGATERADFAIYVTSLDCPIIARDGGRLVVPIRFVTKTNDVLRKRQLLDT